MSSSFWMLKGNEKTILEKNLSNVSLLNKQSVSGVVNLLAEQFLSSFPVCTNGNRVCEPRFFVAAVE